MVDGTRIPKLDDAVQKLRETSDRQQQLMTKIAHKIKATDSKYEKKIKNNQELQQKKERPPGFQSGNRQEKKYGRRDSITHDQV